VRARAEARKRYALLRSELTIGGKALHDLSGILQDLQSPLTASEHALAIIERNRDLLAPSKLADMLREYVDLERSLKDLEQSAKDAGID
jgi:hypothetical protein